MTGLANGPRDFFISVSQADRAWAEWIAYTLEANGYPCAIQAWDFRWAARAARRADDPQRRVTRR